MPASIQSIKNRKQLSTSPTHQDDEHAGKQGGRDQGCEEGPVFVKVRLRGKALPMLVAKLVQALSTVHHRHCRSAGVVLGLFQGFSRVVPGFWGCSWVCLAGLCMDHEGENSCTTS